MRQRLTSSNSLLNLISLIDILNDERCEILRKFDEYW